MTTKENSVNNVTELETDFTDEGEVTMVVEPRIALHDVPVEIRLSGLIPSQPVTLRARTADQQGQIWEAWATYAANADGVVDVKTQAPLSGSFTGIEPMSLFWSMRPQDREHSEDMFLDNPALAPQSATITAEEQGEILACVEITRLYVLPEPEITRQSIREDGLVGTLFYPPSPGPQPTVIVLGGGDGGLREGRAALLASHGYVTLALAYFGIESLPDELLEIPLEYFGKAIDWLTTQRMVDAERIAVMGQSKGGELALLLGVTYPKIRAVVAYVPNAVVCQGLSVERTSQKSSWSMNGKGLDHMPCITPRLDKPTALEPFCSKCLEDTAAVERAAIPVENINGPVLLISAKADQVNPSSRMAEMVVSRLAQHSHPYVYEHLCYEGAGHAIEIPYLPTTGQVSRNLIYGGEPQANAFASADSWRAMLDFLDRHLHQG